MVPAQRRPELENADPHRPFTARLSGRPVGGLSGVHRGEGARCSGEVPLFPRRGTLGHAAAEPPRVVGHGARLARSVPATGHRWRSPPLNEPFSKLLTRSTLGALALGAVLVVALPRHRSLGADFVNTFSVAFCFTFFGSYIDALRLALPALRIGMARLVRLAGWFAVGLWCYLAARCLSP